MKRIRRIAIGLAAIVAVLLALPLLVYVPPVQRWLVGKATAIASEATDMDISIGDVGLRFPLTLTLGRVAVVRTGDTIAAVERVEADVALLPLLKRRAELAGISVSGATLNTLDLISDTQLSGTVGRLAVGPALADLRQGTVGVTTLQLADADLCILLSDTAATDTTQSQPLPWRVAVGETSILRSRVALHTPGDSVVVEAMLAEAMAGGVDVDLLNQRYQVASLRIDQSTLAYDNPFTPPMAQPLSGKDAERCLMDYAHLDLRDLSLAADTIVYANQRSLAADTIVYADQRSLAADSVLPPPYLSLNVRHASMKERCGLHLADLKGRVLVDSLGIRLPALALNTPYSSLYATASIDYASFGGQTVEGSKGVDSKLGNSQLTVSASLSHLDIAHFHPLKGFPNWPLALKAEVRGNVRKVDIADLTLDLPTVLHAEAAGTVNLPSAAVATAAKLRMQLQAYNAAPLLKALDVDHAGVTIPAALRIDGMLESDGRQYAADVNLRDGKATAKARLIADMQTEAYTADIEADTLEVGRFMPTLPLAVAATAVKARGRGFDPYGRNTFMEATATFGSLTYDTWRADSLTVEARHEEAKMVANVATGRLATKQLSLSKGVIDIGLAGKATVETNIRDSHKLSCLLTDIVIRDSTGTYHPENLGLLLNARPDTTYARIQNGNFIVKMDASGPYDRLFAKLATLADTLSHQAEKRIIDQQSIKGLLPQLRLYLTCGRDNVPANFIRASRDIDFSNIFAEITMSAEEGLNGHVDMDKLAFGSTKLDSIRLTLKDSAHGLTYQARVANGKSNPLKFTALMDGHLYEHGARVGVRLFDKGGRQGLRIGAQASMEAGGIRFTLMPKTPTIAFREFTINDDNFLFLSNDLRLSAKLEMEDSDGTTIDVYSALPEASAASAVPVASVASAVPVASEASAPPAPPALLQDLTVSTTNLNLKQLTDIAPFLPSISGMLNGDFHVIMNDSKQISVAADIDVNSLAYEGSDMGDVDTEFVYLQNADDTHSVDGILLRNGQQVAAFDGKYINKKVSGGHEYLDGTLNLINAPLNMVNGFIEDHIAGLEGYANGSLSMKGPIGQLLIDGSVRLDSAIVYSLPYGISMEVDDSPITIEGSKLTLDNYKLFPVASAKADTLSITGTADFSSPGATAIDFRIRARELQLINAKQQAGSLLYGKGFISMMAMARGTTEKMSVRGRVDVLGKTDVTYLLLQSPLSTDNQMDELVKFTDFSDSTEVVAVERPMPRGMNVSLNVYIDQGAHVRCGLNAEQSNYVDLFGGGELRLRMSETEDMTLTGRYTIANGSMKYSLPVIPLKTFSIQDGSYVEFTGRMDNPTLNITATERTRAAVGQEGEASRIVTFDCGVLVTKTLNDMGLQFIISSPEDMTLQSELQAMTLEQRGKLAVTMLTTGMYLADGNTSGFSMNSALSSFLQSEINNIAGNALSTLDVSLGVDNTTDASGNMHTDYSFQFAKRFWNNRLKVQIGGKVSSGQEAADQGQKQSFFDNVSMEYRLSPTSNQHLKLFYKQNVYDWLDGYTSEYGGGYVYKRKMDHWWDMFRLWKIESNTGRR